MGLTRYQDVDPAYPTRQSSIYVQVLLPHPMGVRVYALVDTGAAYCIFNSEITEALGFSPHQGEAISLSTRFGSIRGTLQRLTIGLLAEQGDSLNIDATLFVTDEWNHGNFIGYGGFLDRVRFAVDPGTNSFYFGMLG